MKKFKIVFFILVTFATFSCSKDDSSTQEKVQVIPEPTLEELLTNSSPWTFTNYEMLNMISTTNETITNADINNHTTNLLAGFVMNFKEDSTVIISHPLSRELSRTWVLFNEDIIFDSESSTPQIWKNIQIDNNILSLESNFFTIFENSFDSVEHYGKLHFE